MNRTVLIIAFHFPPVASSSGMQRALKTVRYLREDGWRPVVLTADPRGYEATTDSQLAEIPDDVPVRRAFCLDAKRHFAIRGSYPGFLAWPDAWITWYPFAVAAGRRLIREHQPAIIWSTFPISTANLVARNLSQWSGLPWIADLRDPMTLDGYPPEPMRFRLVRRVERSTMKHAAHVVFTADYTRRIYTERYPAISNKTALIRNGYDESNFPSIETAKQDESRPQTLLHSGALQPKGRHPGCFLEAIARLHSRGIISGSNLSVVFRGSGNTEEYTALAKHLGIEDVVKFEPAIPYEQAIAEMVESDALLVFQGTAYNYAIPAKLYEYFFAGKPVLGIVDKKGETQAVLSAAGISRTASIDDSEDIADAVSTLVEGASTSDFLPRPDIIAEYSRRKQTLKLSALLEETIMQRAVSPHG